MIKPIPSFPNYFVKDNGKVLKRENGRMIDVEFYFYNQYKKVKLVNKNGKIVEFPIHKLIAEGFCSGRKDKSYEAHHKNSNRHDNRASNLIWLSKEDHKELHRQKLIQQGRFDLLKKFH